MLYWNSFEQHPFPGSLMKPRSEIQCLSEYPLGRLSGACRGQAEAITAELPDSGEMSLGTGVSDVQVRAERVVQGSLAGGCSKLQLLGRGINKRQCGMQRQQRPQRVLHIPPTAGKHLPHETQSDAR